MNAHWMGQITWQQSVVQDDRGFRWGRLGTDYVAEWIGLVSVRMDAAGLMKHVVPAPEAPPELIEKTIRGEVAAFVRHLKGRFSLHASAVALRGRAIVLTGVSGAGKSTAAYALCSLGAELLADDVAGFVMSRGKIGIEPSERFVWLGDSRGAKVPVHTRVAAAPSELAAIVSLRLDDAVRQPSLARIRGAGTLKCVLEGFIRFDVAPEPRSREFDSLVDLAVAVPVWQLVRPAAESREQIAALLAPLALSGEGSCHGATA